MANNQETKRKSQNIKQKMPLINRILGFSIRMFIREDFIALDKGTLNYWRDRVFCLFGILIIVFVGPIFILGSFFFIKYNYLLFAIVQFCTYLIITLIFFLKKIKISIRAFIVLLVLYGYCIFLLLSVGSVGAGLVSTLAILVLSGTMLKGKKLYALVYINIITYAILTILLYLGFFTKGPMQSYYTSWPIAAATTQACGICLLILSRFIYKQLEYQTQVMQMQKERIWDNEQRYRTIFNQSAIGIFYTTRQGDILDVNIRSCEMLGFARYELLGMKLRDVIHPDDVDDVCCLKTQSEKNEAQVFSGQARLITHANKIVHISIYATVTAQSDTSPGYVVWSFADITKRINLEQKNIQIEARLRNQQRLEAVGTLSSGVAHEVNNPLNGIMNYGQLILDSQCELPNVRRYATEIISETERISDIIQNLLHYSRQEKQILSVDYAHDILEHTLMLIRTMIRKDSIELVIDEADQPLPLRCHRQKVQQVLINLIINAKDALNTRYPLPHADKIIRLSTSDQVIDNIPYVRFTVEDHGEGIPEDAQDRVFEPFFSTKPKESGTGLGLYVCYGIIKEHNGRISFESKQNQYTRFHVDLPAFTPSEE